MISGNALVAIRDGFLAGPPDAALSKLDCLNEMAAWQSKPAYLTN
jgi:hypothetical protein